MSTSTKVSPPNSLVLICDPAGGHIPKAMRGSLISSTASCIAVGTRAEDDGETEIILGGAGDSAAGDRIAYEGTLKTPSRKIVVRSVLGAALLEMPVASDETSVRVWVNDPQEPDRIVVGIA